MPAVQFSIPSQQWEKLENSVEHGESVHQAAKRLLINLLDGESSTRKPDPEEMDYIKHRLDRLEEIVQLGNPAGPDRLDKLESELKSLALQFSERVYELSQQVQALDLSPLESRLSEIERRLDSLPAAAVSPVRLPAATRRGA